MRSRTAAVILALATACGSACVPSWNAGAEFAPSTQIPGTGIVYVYRPQRARAALMADTLYVGNRANLLFNGSVVAFALAPGTHELVVGGSSGVNVTFDLDTDQNATRVPFDVREGGATYIRVRDDRPAEVTIVDDHTATSELHGLRYAFGGQARYVPDR